MNTIFFEATSHRARESFLKTNIPFEAHRTEPKIKDGARGVWWIHSREIYKVSQDAMYKIQNIKGLKFLKELPK